MVTATALLILEILTTTLPDGVAGRPYHVRLQAQGGRPPYVWSLAEGALLRSLKLVEATGEITGRPARGEARFVVEVTDSDGESYRMALRLLVADPIRLLTLALPPGFGGTPYRTELRAAGGVPPYRWEVVGGALPEGLRLDRDTGVLSGTPSTGGAFEFSARLTDSARPPQTEIYSFALRMVVPLSVGWKELPRVAGGGIFGSLLASNGARDSFDLTVIVVAVNEYGKAFTLGHHHFPLPSETSSRELRFGFSLPRGRYTVHADAVAEVASKNQIFRARLQQLTGSVE